MNTNELKQLKSNLKLTARQRDILVGTLLGDGHLETQNNGRTYRLKVEHGVAQEEYVMWLYKEFSEWVRGIPYRRKRRDGREFIGFTTYSHGALRFYAHQFYDGKKKVVPRLIHKIIKPLSIAVWYMDDGSRKSAHHTTYIFHTNGFKKTDLERIQVALAKQSIETCLHKQERDQWRVYVKSRDAHVLKAFLTTHMSDIVTMQYKIG